MKTILITGAAGFIGSNLAQALVSDNKIIGFDNVNDYYDVNLKEYRLSQFQSHENFTFIKGDLTDK
ncbi:GDP-mannose 4,6 dehydratase [Dethiosulfatibacter aminovorans DSM 17477]|uniref:GDP-mannose 4,6 dehydratase n=1 Tax=Dethiosulfatibacter aminovorans DSM 17477 TaxID=1121476 RepID=A0A1M6NBQ1_9FIRM|nr:GDP-mannose 4,6 dehydratase [Dethiosulfatibacter aminovorans DSM 17477]